VRESLHKLRSSTRIPSQILSVSEDKFVLGLEGEKAQNPPDERN